MTDPLRDCRAKLKRGEEQLDALYAEILETLEADPVLADGQTDTQRPDPATLPDGTLLKTFTISVIHAPVIPRCTGLLVGEVLHNFRSSLDHLAWALVKHAGQRELTASQARKVQFPMARKRRTLEDRWSALLRGVPKAPYLAVIDEFQPYRRTTAGRAMRTLRNLSDTDKHRLLVPAAAFPFDVNLEIKVDPPWTLVGHHKWPILNRPVKAGTKLATLLLVDLGPGKTTVEMNGNFRTYPELPGRIPLEATFNSIRNSCAECIERIAALL